MSQPILKSTRPVDPNNPLLRVGKFVRPGLVRYVPMIGRKVYPLVAQRTQTGAQSAARKIWADRVERRQRAVMNSIQSFEEPAEQQ